MIAGPPPTATRIVAELQRRCNSATKWRRQFNDERGTSTIELALLAPFFSLLVLGTVDASRAVGEKIRLQQAAARTIELASAGGLDGDSWDNLSTEAAEAAKVSDKDVEVDRWLECNRQRQESFDGTCESNEEVGRYASITVRNQHVPWFADSLAGLGWDVSRAITIEGEASVRLQ